MESAINKDDKELMKFLTDSNNFNSSITEIQFKSDIDYLKLLPSIIVNIQKKDKIVYLLKLFDNLYPEKDNKINYVTIKAITKNIINYFLNSKYNSNFPRNLFKGNFLKYLIDTDKFFTSWRGFEYSLFGCILSKKENIDYFNIEISKDYITEYTSYVTRLYNHVNKQIMMYSTLPRNTMNKCLNIIYLISDYREIENKTNTKLDNKIIKLFLLVYSYACENISLNSESREVYRYINPIFGSKNNLVLKQIDEDISNCYNIVNILKLNDTYTKLVIEKLLDFDIEKASSRYFEEILRVLPYSIREDLYIGKNYNRYFEKCKNLVEKILNLQTINIHHKTKFVLEADLNLFNNDTIILELIELFIKIEPFNVDSGFNDKPKVRKKIIEIILKHGKKDIINSLSKNIYDEFTTLYTAHINELLCKLVKYREGIMNIPTNNFSTNNFSRLLVIKYILSLKESIKLFKFFDLRDNNSHFYYKQAELLFSFLKYVTSSKLYNELSLSDKKDKRLVRFVDQSCIDNLENIFLDIFNYLKNLIYNESFINELGNHLEFYSEKDVEISIEKYGSLDVSDNFSVKDILTIFMEKVKEEKVRKMNTEEKYSTEVPNKFLDPILFCKINDPIEIPEVKQIVDKYTIMNHLTFSETNPFTNKELSKKDLEEYNNQPEVLERIEVFKKQFNEWKDTHKI